MHDPSLVATCGDGRASRWARRIERRDVVMSRWQFRLRTLFVLMVTVALLASAINFAVRNLAWYRVPPGDGARSNISWEDAMREVERREAGP